MSLRFTLVLTLIAVTITQSYSRAIDQQDSVVNSQTTDSFRNNNSAMRMKRNDYGPIRQTFGAASDAVNWTGGAVDSALGWTGGAAESALGWTGGAVSSAFGWLG